MTRTSERRGSARFPAFAHRLKLEWWDGGEAKSAMARLVNISRDGALLAIDIPPPVRQTVWLKLEDIAPKDWIGASVVRHDVQYGAGLHFPESCPFDFYQAAILGIGHENLFELRKSEETRAESKGQKADQDSTDSPTKLLG